MSDDYQIFKIFCGDIILEFSGFFLFFNSAHAALDLLSEIWQELEHGFLHLSKHFT